MLLCIGHAPTRPSQSWLICASTHGTDEGERTALQGLVQGHAYTVQSVVKVEGLRMLRLRNPWGQFEWTGEWSDASPLWEQHGAVKAKCRGGEVKDDGFFWMEWRDFRRHFQTVDVCARSRSVKDVSLPPPPPPAASMPLLSA